jgi:hypothetical protein
LGELCLRGSDRTGPIPFRVEHDRPVREETKTCIGGARAYRPPVALGIDSRQRDIDALDECLKIDHIRPEEFGRRFIRDFTAVCNQTRARTENQHLRCRLLRKRAKALEVAPVRGGAVTFRRSAIAANVGSFMNSAAPTLPPVALVKSIKRRACSSVHAPALPRVPTPVANDVTIVASTAREKSTTPFHCACVNTPAKPDGGLEGAASESGKYVVFAHVPLTRT